MDKAPAARTKNNIKNNEHTIARNKTKTMKLMTRAILQNTFDVVIVHYVFVWCFVLLIVFFFDD